ncbi:MAG TPA: hypothetical protein VFL14_06395 [Xanthomonadales bacterium]|nr:hypothetical protein [Xanthomonadales bacterium]
MHEVEIQQGDGYVVARITGDYGGLADGQRVIELMRAACEQAGCRALVLVREAGRAANPLQLVEMLQGLATQPLAGWRLALVYPGSDAPTALRFLASHGSRFGLDSGVFADEASAIDWIARR